MAHIILCQSKFYDSIVKQEQNDWIERVCNLFYTNIK